MEDRILLSAPHMSGYEKEYIEEAFDLNWIALLGKNVDEFEKKIKDYVGINSTLALSSGTAAIHLALKALGVGRGDIVFCQSLTFSASANPILYEGAIPVFIDSDRDNINMCPKALMKAFEKYKPKAVIVVHLYGHPAKMDEILEICNEYGVPVLEDAAESLGSTYKGKQTGTMGEIGIYSFNGNKIITTSGGGMMVSNKEEYIELAKFWATQSREDRPYYYHKDIGYNYRLSNISAGIGRGQMKVLNERIKRKKEIFYRYKDNFRNIKALEMMNLSDYVDSNCWLSVVYIDRNSGVLPADIIKELENHNIESRHIWRPMHMQPIFEKYDYIRADNIDVSNNIYEVGLCLPSGTGMSNMDVDRVSRIIKELF